MQDPAALQGVRILPSASRVQDEQLEAWRRDGADPALRVEPIHWRALVQQIADAGDRKRRLDGVAARLLLRAVIEAAGELEHLGPVVGTRGFVQAVYRLTTDCRAAGVGPEALAAFAEQEGDGILSDVARLYADYLSALREGGFGPEKVSLSDPASLVQDAATHLSGGSGPIPGLPEGAVVFVVDRFELTVAEGALLVALARRLAPEGRILALANTDLSGIAALEADAEERRQAALAPFARSLPENLFHMRPTPLPERAGPLGRLIRGLFREDQAPLADPAELAEGAAPSDPTNLGQPPGAADPADAPSGGDLAAFEAPDVLTEAREVAARIRDLLDAGTAPEDIAVAAPDWTRHLSPMQRALDDAGVRWTPPDKPALSSSPVAGAALAVLDLVRNGFPRDDLIALLGGGDSGLLISPRQALGPAFRDGAQVADLLRRAGARHQHAAGEGEATSGADAGYRAHLAALAAHEEAEGHPERGARARSLADACEALFTRLAPLGLPHTLSQGAALVRRLLGELGLLPLTEDRPPGPRGADGGDGDDALARRELRSMARDQAAARELVAVLDQLIRMGRLMGDPTLSPAGLRQVIAEAIAATRLPTRGARGAQVVLIPLSQLGGRGFERVFIIGLNDGALPSALPADPFLPDGRRRAFNAAQGAPVFMDTAAHRRLSEARQLLLGVAAAREGLVLSWPLQEEGDRRLLPSPFVDDLKRAAPELEVERLPASLIPPLHRCRGRRDLLLRLAADVVGLPEEESAPRPEAAPSPSLAAAVADASAQPALWDTILRGAAAEHDRLRFFLTLDDEGGPWVGRLRSPLLKARLRGALPGGDRSPLSTRQLERWANCGFQYLADRIFGIEEQQEQAEELDQRQGGTLLHDALEILYLDLRERGLLPVSPENLPAALGRVAPALDAAGGRWQRTQPLSHPGLFDLRRSRMELQLRSLLRFEADPAAARGPRSKREDRPFEPLYFERSFGYPEVEGAPPPLPALAIPNLEGSEAVYLRGRIDRIDKVDGGYRLVDYKSGSVGSHRAKLAPDALLQHQLQLALYALAIKELMPGAGRVDALYYALRTFPPDTPTVAEALETLRAAGGLRDEDPRDALELALLLQPGDRQALPQALRDRLSVADRVWAIVEGMRDGDFRVQPQSCKFCDYRTACRVMDLRQGEEEA